MDPLIAISEMLCNRLLKKKALLLTFAQVLPQPPRFSESHPSMLCAHTLLRCHLTHTEASSQIYSLVL